jgi:hypothetical protein
MSGQSRRGQGAVRLFLAEGSIQAKAEASRNKKQVFLAILFICTYSIESAYYMKISSCNSVKIEYLNFERHISIRLAESNLTTIEKN